jgi:hypothetical protein
MDTVSCASDCASIVYAYLLSATAHLDLKQIFFKQNRPPGYWIVVLIVAKLVWSTCGHVGSDNQISWTA